MFFLFQPKSISEIMKSYKKFLFVRHPMERLVSAFRDKFKSNTTDADNFRYYHAKRMMSYFRKQKDVDPFGKGIKFWEFLGYLTKIDPSKLQEHWKPYYHLCHPCAVDYDFIGNFSNLKSDADHILEDINFPKNISFPKFKLSKTSQYVEKYLESVPIDILQLIASIFEPDFKLFGYS